METRLNPIEARVMATLVEKEITTPNNYPLTLTSLTTACNQKSNRYPVTDLTEEEVARALYNLREQNIAWETAPSGSRGPSTTKPGPTSSARLSAAWPR